MHVAEVAESAAKLAAAIASGEYDDDPAIGAFQVELDHLMGHLALAWHYARRTDEEIDALSSEQFATLMNAIPRLNVDQRLVEPWDRVV